MKRQLAKGLTMLMLVVALAFVTAVASANAQSRHTRANVPFDFIVGDSTLAAGTYSITGINTAGDCLMIRNTQAKDASARLTMPLNGKSKHAKLVFHRYDQRYFLAEVWTDSFNGRELTTSRQERAIQKEAAKLASLNGVPAGQAYEIVEIATAMN